MDERAKGRTIAAELKPGVAVRLAASHALGRVMRDGAYANIVVEAEAKGLSSQDRAFLQHLLFGALRQLRPIDAALAKASSRPLDKVQDELLDVLRVAGFELLTGGAPHAAVSTAVDAARARAGERAGGFANAVLRAFQPVPDVGAYPLWIADELSGAYGPDWAEAFMAASDTPARLGVFSLEASDDIDAVPGIIGAGYTTGSGADLENETTVVMDPASAAVVQAMDLQPGHRVVDLAAAPGGKTRAAALQLGEGGRLVAVDINEKRLKRAAARASAERIQWVIGDSATPPLARHSFDRVLLDAPCSGLGTLRRRPEIRHRLDPGAPAELARLQRKLLDAALELVAPGGMLVYSVCTVFPQETTEVVAGHDASPPDLPGERHGGGVLLSPHVTGTDGMFVTTISPE